MSTTDALLLATSSAIAHDLLGAYFDRKKLSERARGRINVAVVWLVGAVALVLAYSPPKLLSAYYTEAVGLLSAALFVPMVGGLWYRRANRAGGVWALLVGAGIYAVALFVPAVPRFGAILLALPASALTLWLVSRLGRPDADAHLDAIAALHRDEPEPGAGAESGT